MKTLLAALQSIGRALMLPIAVLPVAGLLLRLGQPDLLDVPLLAAAGNALFSNLGLLFAIGVATGLARDGNGAAALSGVTCYLVAVHGARALLDVPAATTAGMATDVAATVADAFRAKAIARLDVPIGMIAGIAAGQLYNRFSGITLPAYLSFFGGRRFVPIVAGIAGLLLAGVIGLGYGALSTALDHLGTALTASGSVGLFVFGVLNRLLLVTGLHHILNNIAWFVLGDYQGTTGDLRRFFAGDPSAGKFMSGFFPIMMFGLPAACLAIYRNARPERRKEVGGLLASLAATSFLTGVTEPIEFSFMFLAPALYVVHALLTGAAMVVMDLLGVHLGFGFSAGLFDYVLNFAASTRPLMLLPVGAAFFAIYFLVFDLAIRRFNLATPGRETVAAPIASAAGPAAPRAQRFLAALGGGGNILTLGACTTRLRLMVVDPGRVDDAALKALGAMGILRPSAGTVQVIVGPVADVICAEIAALTDRESAPEAPPPATSARAVRPAAAVVEAIGGAAHLKAASLAAGRLRLDLGGASVSASRLEQVAGVAAAVEVGGGVWHLLGDPAALIAD
ncbi:N-acetylglucosamine-specific PTS transporter subunit IIBC [uncultured Sphingomonas sp.]|uniref:N-acetylglucosamine-specific PTS transporter subunit IIBC n=1 Tax=uncultured Sphingomonas sp. TaxID=158754 RepID=UPI0025DDD661|nr:N-acetylglucosamine-specific PTS transporter subunit IIBC [uncultured Sphingomonas sp.]